MAEEKQYRVRLLIPSLKVLQGLAVDSEDMPMRQREDGQIEMEAFVPDSTLTKLRRMRQRNVDVEVLAESKEGGADLSNMVSRGNRYADGSLPHGLGSRKG
jgi:hypothetical protein